MKAGSGTKEEYFMYSREMPWPRCKSRKRKYNLKTAEGTRIKSRVLPAVFALVKGGKRCRGPGGIPYADLTWILHWEPFEFYTRGIE